jgi:hypothetical protein
LDKYSANDKEELKVYMLKMNLKEPVDVWYHNMRAFLTIEMDAQKAWVRKIIELAYPPDAMWFRMHVEGTFSLRTTEQQGDEFSNISELRNCAFEAWWESLDDL